MLMRTKSKRINELINPYDTTKPNLPALTTSTGETAVSSDALTSYVFSAYGFLSVYYPDTFFECFAKHVSLYQRSIDRVYYAWNAEYNPLDNVDAYEERITGKSVDDVISNNGKVKTSGNNSSGTTAKESTITDTTPVTTAQNELTSNTDTTTEQITDSIISHTNSLSVTDTENNTINNATETTHDIYRRHGNIGVTKSTELVSSEIELRNTFAYKQIIDTIIEMCGVYYENEV